MIHNPVTAHGAASATATAATAGDPVPLQTTLTGAQVMRPNCLPGQQVDFNSNGAAVAQNDTTVFAAAGAGIRNYMTGMQLMNGATASVIKITDGAGGTVLWALTVPANQPIVDIQFPRPLRGTANTALVVNSSAVGGTVQMSAQGYTSTD